jgi:hypothetical protein
VYPQKRRCKELFEKMQRTSSRCCQASGCYTPAAKRYLLQYKQLEAAIATLFADTREEDDQDYRLLDE